MSDLLGGATMPATTNGHDEPPSRPTAPPEQTGSPSQAIRGPRMIMKQRAEREARRAEREQLERMERTRAEEEARLLEEQKRRAAERAAAGAGAAGEEGRPLDPMTQRRQQREQRAQQEAQGAAASIPTSMPQPTTPQQTAPLRPTRLPAQGQAPQGFAGVPPTAGAASGAGVPVAESSAAGAAGGGRTKNTFPHAFERWEAMSAHWEGMTSFWIRKLQANTEEVDRTPVSNQLARQVTDLSAAGANLFHAIVELQRLRASSERKFQRWFFETRQELERNQEANAMLQAALEEERMNRNNAIRDAVSQDRANSKIQKQLAEMKRELAISKEEARRAWEELGRREQEERDRTLSLQMGRPTIVGGVQVVPMTQGGPSRGASLRDPGAQGDSSEYMAAPTGGGYPDYGQAPPSQSGAGSAAGPSSSTYHQQGGGSEAGDSEEDVESSASPVGTNYPPSSSQWGGAYANPGDYSGQGYGAPAWEAVPTRHHHPTRLSDVMEEDERSRTSASQVSRV